MSERKKSEQISNNDISHLALYRKYRPQNLNDIVGQTRVTDILKAAADQRNFAHAYLFTGQRGTGKTSVARILAHLINQTPYDANTDNQDIDIIEIDAASHGSVDDARDLRDKSALAPLKSKHKVYIIDEVHMLSRQAFDALLKLIEEPPTHLFFILATTEIQKVPATILSRVQRFHFRPYPTEIVTEHLRDISDKEKINIDDKALSIIAERGNGSFRDSITLLDQLSNNKEKITSETVREILGLAPEEFIINLISAINNKNTVQLVRSLDKMYNDGLSASVIVNQLNHELLKLAPQNLAFYDLLEKLLEVAKSADPQLKLTAILAQATISENSFHEKSNPNKNDSQKMKIPQEKIQNQKSDSSKQENSKEKLDENKTLAQVATESKNSAILAESEIKSESEKLQLSDFPDEINWQDILKTINDLNQPLALSTLKFADPEYKNGTLILYFAKAFHRDKAETAKVRDILNSALQKLYSCNIEIKIAKIAVREDSDAAKILDIMGGGEIVKNGKA